MVEDRSEKRTRLGAKEGELVHYCQQAILGSALSLSLSLSFFLGRSDSDSSCPPSSGKTQGTISLFNRSRMFKVSSVKYSHAGIFPQSRRWLEITGSQLSMKGIVPFEYRHIQRHFALWFWLADEKRTGCDLRTPTYLPTQYKGLAQWCPSLIPPPRWISAPSLDPIPSFGTGSLQVFSIFDTIRYGDSDSYTDSVTMGRTTTMD